MGKGRKESRQFNMSAEGINCETMYFEHLARLINTSEDNKYNIKLNCRKSSPGSFAKRMSHLPTDKCGNKKIPFLHVQDIEDYYDEEQLARFKHAKEFQEILDEFVTLESVVLAVKRADAIVQANYDARKKQENYRGFQFFRDNPDINVHEMIKLIFDVCGVVVGKQQKTHG